MNIYIMTDLEGMSGVYSREQVVGSPDRIFEGRVMMTEDINACVDAAKAAGADKIYVRDGHGGSDTVIYEKLSDNADYYICGDVGEARYAGLEDCDAVILLGYHAMAGTLGAVLEHTYSSENIQNYWLDGKKVGEAEIDAIAAGELGKPVIMASGDDKLCAEVRAFLPNTVTCEVKRGLTWNGAMLMPREKAHKKIAECTKEAIEKFKAIAPYQKKGPHTLRIELCERGVLPFESGNPRIKIIDGRTFEKTADTITELMMTR